MGTAPDSPATGVMGAGRIAVPARSALVVGAGIILALALAFWHRPHAPPPIAPAPPPPVHSPTTTSRAAAVTVHVSGAVSDPGLVTVPEGGRVADAIAAAGGARPGGQLGSINLAAPVTDGMHIVVPWVDDGLPAPVPGPGAGSWGFPVDVNRAGMDRLTDLPGVGEVLAVRIVAHRERHGPFGSLEDLLDVPGIGEGKLAGLRDYAVAGR